MPQIEVTFDIDANGILHVSAKDKNTGKEQSIVIKAKGGLSDEEVERMVQDAEKHAESDKQFHELMTAVNEAEHLVHSTKKSISEAGENLTADEKKGLEEAVNALEEAVKEKDIEKIKACKDTLNQSLQPLTQKLYANKQSEATDNTSNQDQAANDDVVDADFKEVKDEDK